MDETVNALSTYVAKVTRDREWLRVGVYSVCWQEDVRPKYYNGRILKKTVRHYVEEISLWR